MSNTVLDAGNTGENKTQQYIFIDLVLQSGETNNKKQKEKIHQDIRNDVGKIRAGNGKVKCGFIIEIIEILNTVWGKKPH